MKIEERKIKDVPDVPSDIFRAASSGRLVVFVGAGVSRIVGCPLWKELALKQLEDLRGKGAINYYEFRSLSELDARRILSICKRIYREKSLPNRELASLVGGSNELKAKYGSIYNALYAFNAIYVTTNYDEYLDEVASQPYLQPVVSSGQSPLNAQAQDNYALGKVIYKKDDILISNLNNGAVVHLHGSIKDERNAIVTIVDYMQHYQAQGKPAVFLEEIFTNYTVLFVGYGLEEYEILEYMVTKSRTGNKETRHFMLYPIFKQELNLLRFQEKYYADLGILLIPYPIDDNGYEQLVTVIEKWAGQIGPIAKPQGFFEKVKLIDEVI